MGQGKWEEMKHAVKMAVDGYGASKSGKTKKPEPKSQMENAKTNIGERKQAYEEIKDK